MKVHDRVCGMEIDAEDAAATVEYEGTTYYFCSDACRQAFEKDPERYAIRAESGGGSGAHGQHHH